MDSHFNRLLAAGGPAFPHAHTDGAVTTSWAGMTLRDWFAGQALSGILADSNVVDARPAAFAAYQVADHMFAARSAQAGDYTGAMLDALREGLQFVEDWMLMRGYPEHADEWCLQNRDPSSDAPIEPDSVYAKRDRLRAAIAKAEGRS